VKIRIGKKSKHNVPEYVAKTTEGSFGHREMTYMKVRDYLTLLVFVVMAGYSCSQKIVPHEISRGKGKEYDSAAFDYVFVEAIKQKLTGNPGEAMKYFEQCIRINPESDAVYYQIGLILLSGGDPKNAKNYFLKAQGLEPANFWYLMMLAGTYYQQNNLDSAIIYYEKAVNNYPEQESLKLTLGKLYSENKRYEKASELFESLNKKYGINEASTVASVNNFMMSEDFDKALSLALALVEKYPDNILYNGLLAEIYRGKGEESKATGVYDMLMKNNPDNPETQLSLCEFLLSQKKYEELISLLNIVVLNDKIKKEQKIELFAGMFENQDFIDNQTDNLILQLMILEAAYEKDGIIMLLRPDLLDRMKRYEEASARLEEIISNEPDNYFAWEKLLLVYFDAGNFKKLQERGEECALRFNRSFLAKILYATGATQNNDHNTALEELKKATILAGDNKEMMLQVLTIKADVYYRMKNYELAFKTFDEAISKNNDDITLLNNYAYYLAEQGIRLKEAEKMSKEVIEREKDNNTFLDTYGWVLYKRGKLKNAKIIFEKIINSGEKPDPEWYEHYGYILRKKRDCKGAVQSWNMAIKLDSTKTELLNEIEKCGK